MVVLPASMCAMMPIFLHRSNGTVLGTCLLTILSGLSLNSSSLPPIVRESLVGFRHAVDIVFLLDRSTLPFAASSNSLASFSAMPFSAAARA